MWRALRKALDAITFRRWHHLLDEGKSKSAPEAPAPKKAKP